ncbi:MAG: hypothetical protein AB8C95_04705 [Phycisphaeraceae bacterium]
MGVGAVLVDIDRHRDPLSSGFVNTLVYMDADGNIYERTELLDKSSPDRKDLREEYEDGAEKPLRPRVGTDPNGPGGPDFGPGIDF